MVRSWRWSALALLSCLAVVARAEVLPCFGSAQLAQAIAASVTHPTLIYVWSPRMALSVQHAQSVQAQAAAAGLAFLPVHDARIDAGQVQAAVARVGEQAAPLANSQPLCAPALDARDALRHFPTAFVLRAGGLHGRSIVGAMPPAFWGSSLRQRLEIP